MKPSSTTLRMALLMLPCILVSSPLQPASALERNRPSLESTLFTEPQQAAQPPYNPLAGPSYPIIQDSYFTDDNGNILMTVNVLGEVNRPGQLVVSEHIDFGTLLALSGGSKGTANLSRVLIARREPDSSGKQAYILDLKRYYKHGDRSMFIALKPNDTIIIPERGMTLDNLSRVAAITLAGFDIYSIMHNHQ